jgi:MoaA/NifB/PqqE/SkfB family radical SAM enzyme
MNAIRAAGTACNYLWRHMGQEADYRLNAGLCLPDKISITLTSRCNSRCLMCALWERQPSAGEEIPAARWIDLIAELHEWLGAFFLNLSGGEPFVKKGIYDIISCAVSRRISLSLLTNGIALKSHNNLSRLLATGLPAINFSLDGMDPAVHDRFRGTPGLHVAVVEAIRNLKREKPGMFVTAVCIVMKDTIAQLPEFVRWAEGLGIDRVLFQPIAARIGSAEERNPLWHERSPYFVRDLALLDRIVAELVAMKPQSRILGNGRDHLRKFAAYFRTFGTVWTARTRCMKGQTSLMIDERGEIRMCYNQNQAIGSVDDGPLSRTWKGAAARAARRHIRECRLPCVSLANRSPTLAQKARLFLQYVRCGRL